MDDRCIRIIKHEAVPGCGSFEVRSPGSRESQFIYWDDIPARRLRPETLDRETALEHEGGSKGCRDSLMGLYVRASVVAAGRQNEPTARAESLSSRRAVDM